MQAITVITGPRTGAGHLLALLENFEAVAPRDGLFASGVDVSAAFDGAEREAMTAGKSLLVVKATSTLPIAATEALLGRPNMGAIVVVRRQIDAFVSLAKATAMGAWRDTDLSSVKVHLDAARFESWMAIEAAWYAHWKTWLERRGLPVPILRYETQLTSPPDAILRHFAAAAGQLGIVLRAPRTLTTQGLKRQDNASAAAFKVRNWVEFSKALQSHGLEKRAFGYPI
jgi:LPS sulfotransferase NodH